MGGKVLRLEDAGEPNDGEETEKGARKEEAEKKTAAGVKPEELPPPPQYRSMRWINKSASLSTVLTLARHESLPTVRRPSALLRRPLNTGIQQQ